MPSIRLLFLWHMHQPFYKDLVSGEYRLPWVRLHALKDYYGMVKLLDEFPDIHQTFNLVPSLVAQIQDHVAGTARDPLFDVAAKPAARLSTEERELALQYLFQANFSHIINRYPRYLELYEKFEAYQSDARLAHKHFSIQDFADLQVLSQIAWFDEFFLDNPDPALKSLIEKGQNFTPADQEVVVAKEREILSAILPAYSAAAQRGQIELSTSPFYHPILPLLCDTDIAAASCPGLPLPQRRFRHPEDAADQLVRGLDLHERVFGVRPRGVWPSEGSVSEAVLEIAHSLGIEWMATDEGVLGRSIGAFFERNPEGVLSATAASQLYDIYRFRKADTQMHLVFRDHALSDLIGFVYSGMPADEAAAHFIQNIKRSCEPILKKGRNAIVSIILDGENAWEYFPRSGREFLRLLYQTIQDDPGLEARTVSEAIAGQSDGGFVPLDRLSPGSWINSNFNIWIGAPEDNRAWDYLSAARELYDEKAAAVEPAQRALAYEELLIAEGSDWNWWYEPEHSTANDRDFDELYRKHLSNIYHALGETPPEYLAQPIMRLLRRASYTEQTAFIHPRLDGTSLGYFDWIGAAHYKAEAHGAAMHGKRFLLDSAYAGIDELYLYCRLDLTAAAFVENEDGVERLDGTFDLVQTIECIGAEGTPREPATRLICPVQDGKPQDWILEPLTDPRGNAHPPNVVVRLDRVFEMRISLDYLEARIGDTLLLRYSVWEKNLPLDSLPSEGAMRLKILSKDQLASLVTQENWKA